jgi:hypothetical protein
VKPRRRKKQPDSRETPRDDIRTALDAQVQVIAGKVPPEVMDRVLRIRQVIERILPDLSHLPIGAPEAFLIERTATSYLPIALENFLGLPAQARSQPLRDGKTPTQLLLHQLALLEGAMKEVAGNLHQYDADRLLAHGRFLEERLGRAGLSVGRAEGTDTG